ncbi:hypothetical protein FDF12_07490 [Clostridium botulinum]|uniref:hypothetical protein n=1 Tax=Clostridium botulinum TaxID=1491 RepID=UPI00077395D6|nr:hypothetical protein [Clostridium botulinum]NFE95944.1 hypothetical protein [Clostridium botulinum]NFL39427.1 hypothetical protein [Clostridium botulinum]NFL65064.1 hypothetical protein [Clostridium botulinum]NFN09284.1 hypothetical protein [Clostridium botulinum]NFN25894.1 hypothetical protein [Clostridium botulinum]
MKLDITLCYSIIEYYFDNFNQYEIDNKGNRIFDRIKQHSVNLNYELEEKYEEYFRNNRPELLCSYQDFIKNMTYSSEGAKIIDSLNQYSEVDKITDEEYYNILISTCYSTKDKILMSDKCDTFITDLKNIGIEVVKSNQMLDVNDSNIINSYSLPITGKKICHGLSSEEVSKWIGRFLEDETDIEIIDGYIYQNAYNFYNYFLKYIKHGSNLKIYTFLDKIVEDDIISEFTSERYKYWNIEIFIFQSKKQQHARNIFTNKYYIHLEKGMAIFGRNGITDQSDVNIAFAKYVPFYNIDGYKKVI